jgi:hypothetical protein
MYSTYFLGRLTYEIVMITLDSNIINYLYELHLADIKEIMVKAKQSKAVPLHTLVALGVRGGIAATYS